MRGIIMAGHALVAKAMQSGAVDVDTVNAISAFKTAVSMNEWNLLPMLHRTMGVLENGTAYRVLAAACNRDSEAWATLLVVQFEGLLPTDDGLLDEPSLLRSISDTTGFWWSDAGGRGPGEPFAREPWVQAFGNVLVVTQQGGLDV